MSRGFTYKVLLTKLFGLNCSIKIKVCVNSSEAEFKEFEFKPRLKIVLNFSRFKPAFN